MGSLFSSVPKEVDMSGPVAEFVRKTIASDKVVIFSKSYCPYCTTAKEVKNWLIIEKVLTEFFLSLTLSTLKTFKKLNQKATVLEIENREDCGEIQAVLGQITGATSVPRVFVNGNFIGGK